MQNSDHSTEPDKIMGWQQRDLTPKLKQFPLIFVNPAADTLSKSLTSFGHTQNYRVIYMGPRYSSNMKAFKSYCFKQNDPYLPNSKIYSTEQIQKYNFSYTHEKQKFFPIRVQEYRLFSGCNPTLKKEDLRFDSDFQCGNLDLAIYINPVQYDLLMRVDSNTKGHTAWFFFKVSNITAKQKIKFNIINYGKKNLLYVDGMKPYIYKKSKGKWTQQGLSVVFSKKRFRYQGSEKIMYECLSFIYNFTDSEEVYFSYSIPYSYSFLLHRLKYFKQKYPHLLKINYQNESSGGLPIPYLTITNFSSSNEQAKKNILCVGRQHPGQTQGSWMMDGFIQEILSPNGHSLRERNIFYIIPMLNVDGVVIGNFRTGIMGRDLNRCFHYEKQYNEINLIRSLAAQTKPYIFLDFHGHSAKRNVFIYGPDYKIQQRNYLTCRIFPKLISKITEAFRYYSCLFKISSSKVNTGRAVILREFKAQFSYTIQASTHASGPKHQQVVFTSKRYIQMGKDICQALSNFNRFLRILPKRQALKKNAKNQQKKIKNKGKGYQNKNATQDLLQNVEDLEGLSTTQKQMLKQIMKDENSIQKQIQGEEHASDSDCQSKQQDYSAKQLNNIMQAKFQQNKSEKNEKTKTKTKIKRKTKNSLNKSVSKQKNLSINIRSFLERNFPQKKQKQIKVDAKKSETKLQNSFTLDAISQKKNKSTFKEKSSQLLTKNSSYLQGIIKKKSQIIKAFQGERLPSISYLNHQRDNNVLLEFKPRLNKSIESTNHFIFDQDVVSHSVSNKKLEQSAHKKIQKKKKPIFSIKKSALPMVGRSCYTIDQVNHERSMLSQILEEHEKRKKFQRNVRIMYL